jgi:hypothetical protein
MTKYFIQMTVEATRIAAIVEAVYKQPMEFDPQLRIAPMFEIDAEQASEMVRKSGERKAAKAAKPKTLVGVKRAAGSGKRGDLVEAALKTGPKRWSELKTALSAGGLSESSLNSLIGSWKNNGKIFRDADGLWRLKDAQPQAANAG